MFKIEDFQSNFIEGLMTDGVGINKDLVDSRNLDVVHFSDADSSLWYGGKLAEFFSELPKKRLFGVTYMPTEEHYLPNSRKGDEKVFIFDNDPHNIDFYFGKFQDYFGPSYQIVSDVDLQIILHLDWVEEVVQVASSKDIVARMMYMHESLVLSSVQ